MSMLNNIELRSEFALNARGNEERECANDVTEGPSAEVSCGM